MIPVHGSEHPCNGISALSYVDYKGDALDRWTGRVWSWKIGY
mgnify:CR=1 FL=1